MADNLSILRRALAWFSSWWQNGGASVPDQSPPVPLPPLVNRRNRPPRPSPEKYEFTHYRFDHLLDDLDDYFDVIRYMRQADHANYALYRQIGAQLPPEKIGVADWELPASWRCGAPRQGMGMVHYSRRLKDPPGAEKYKDLIPASFVGFRLLKHLKLYQKHFPDSDLFEVTAYYHDKKIDRMAGGTCVMEVSKDGLTVNLLKTPHVSMVPLPPKKIGKWRGVSHVPVRKWDYGFLEGCLEDHIKLYPEDAAKWGTIEEFAKSIFCATINLTQEGTDGFQVRVKKSGITAKFNIGLLRTPYFFKDREKTVTERGTTKRILHIVRPHRRIIEGGEEVWVKSHFRGERKFRWLGYDVIVSMPGKHHSIIEEMEIHAYERDDPDNPKVPMIGPGETGRRIGKVLDA